MSNDLHKLGVITLFVEDVARSKAFYGDAFGLALEFEDATSAVMRMENVLLNLVVRSSAPELIEPAPVAAPGSGSTLMFTIWVADTDAVCAQLAERGVSLLNGPIDRPWGVRTAAFSDPDGNAWEVAQQISR
jgi:catechol 2,3-dioxygenase-like lactoylglutathione lyase family enzyme